VPNGVPLVAVDIRPRNAIPIRGKVLNPDGSPASAAWIAIARDGSSFGPESGTCGPDGTFAVVPVDAGRWMLCAGRAGVVDSDPVEAQTGQEGVILKLKIAASISGEVVCEGCGADRLLQVSLLGEEISRWAGGRPFERSRGFEFTGRRAGTYHVLAQCEPDRVGLVRDIVVKPGAMVSNVRVELTRGAVLVLRYSGKRQVYNFDLWLADVTTGSNSVENGSTRRIIVPPGVVTLRPRGGGREHILTVRAGSETEVMLDDT
jgi:hypothetical protein